jgi:hypothetical protein
MDNISITKNQYLNRETHLSSPWITYFRKLEALFSEDPDVQVKFDEDDLVVRVLVGGTDKADALARLLPNNVSFGNVSVTVRVIPANAEKKKIDLIRDAFNGNPIFSYATTVEGVMTNPITYVIFKKEVVQYYNDSLSDAHGMCSTLYQDIASRVLDAGEGIFFCTNNTMNISCKIPSYTITTSNSYTTM